MCTNAESPHDRHAMLEHDGWVAFEDAGAWVAPTR
jgi:hypothetical protein